MERNFPSSYPWGDSSKPTDWNDSTILSMCELYPCSNTNALKKQVSPSLNTNQIDQHDPRNQMVGGLQLAFQEALKTAGGSRTYSMSEKFKKDYSRDQLELGLDATCFENSMGSGMAFDSFQGTTVGIDNLDSSISNTRPFTVPYIDFKGYNVNVPVLPVPQSQFVMKPDIYMQGATFQQRHSSLPSLAQYPFFPVSQSSLQYPSMLPSINSHVCGVPRQSNTCSYTNSFVGPFNSASMLSSNPALNPNCNSGSMNFMPMSGSYFQNQFYGGQRIPMAAFGHTHIGTALPGMAPNPYPHDITPSLPDAKDETDEDERRKANQRRRKAESRRRLRERDPVGYREKEARARKNRRMKQRARMMESSSAPGSSTMNELTKEDGKKDFKDRSLVRGGSNEVSDLQSKNGSTTCETVTDEETNSDRYNNMECNIEAISAFPCERNVQQQQQLKRRRVTSCTNAKVSGTLSSLINVNGCTNGSDGSTTAESPNSSQSRL